MLSRESAEYLKDYQKQFMPEDADAGMILAFLDNFKGDRVCSKMLWKEALHRDYEPKRIELKQICDIMNNSVTDWIMSDGAMHFGVYGKQRGWVRAGFSQGIPDKADSDGFIGSTEADWSWRYHSSNKIDEVTLLLPVSCYPVEVLILLGFLLKGNKSNKKIEK